MKQSQLVPYAPLYRAALYYGAGGILAEWLGTNDMVLPLLLPHGVEIPGQYQEASDVRGMEPIYWAINAELHEKAKRVKPSILIPHPFLLSPAYARRDAVERAGVLIIGAPPGRVNDRNVLESLKQNGFDSGTVLVKRRVGWQGSERFWESQGFETRTFGDPFEFTYNDMAEALTRYDHVVSTTPSTAAIFAAACGARVTLLRGCALTAYELLGVTEIMHNRVPEASAWLQDFAQSDRDKQRALALALLGDSYRDRERIVAELHAAIAGLDHPLYVENGYYPAFLARLQADLAIWLGKPRLASIRPGSMLRALRKPKVGVMMIKENDYYFEGPSPDTFTLTPTPYRRGVTEPGVAIDPY